MMKCDIYTFKEVDLYGNMILVSKFIYEKRELQF